MTGATSNSPMLRLRKVHERTACTAYSIREIYRAENSPLTLMAPERIDAMVRALLQDHAGQGGVDQLAAIDQRRRRTRRKRAGAERAFASSPSQSLSKAGTLTGPSASRMAPRHSTRTPP
jgi:hypothetical protein